MSKYNDKIALIDKELNKLLNEKKRMQNKVKMLENEAKSAESEFANYNSLLREFETEIVKKRLSVLDKIDGKISNAMEPNWMKWDFESVFFWLKYIVAKNTLQTNENSDNNDEKSGSNIHGIDSNENDTFEIDWDLIGKNLKIRNIRGKYLSLWENQELQEIGLKSKVCRSIVLQEIKRIVSKHPNKSGSDESKLCNICFDNERTKILVPCGHACLCKECSQRYDRSHGCPLCRQYISQIIDFYG